MNRKGKKLAIIYEDEELLVIDKPAGMLTIATDKEREKTAYHAAFEYMKPKHGRVFIVHRLDRDTSGVLLLAKNEKTKRALQDNWDEAVSTRGYVAVVEGRVEKAEGQIRSWLKQTKTLFVYSSRKNGDGKLAITNFRRLEASDKYSLLELNLETGRKNQIRVHMSDMGHPVAGDKKYGAKTDPFKRLALHASVLELTHPTTGESMRFESKSAGFSYKSL